MDSDKNFDHLKVGDDVVVRSNYSNGYRIAKIGHATKTYVVVEGSKYRRDSGYRMGDKSFDVNWLECSDSAFLRARKFIAEKAMKQNFLFNQAGVHKMRAVADETEKVLRESGEWKDAP